MKSINLWNHKPYRVFIIFVVGIIFPASFLSYLGFRSLQVESLLLKKQIEGQYLGLIELAQEKIEDKIGTLEFSLEKVVDNNSFRTWNAPAMTADLLDLSQVGEQPIKKIFIFNDQEKMIIPFQFDPHLSNSPFLNELDWGTYKTKIEKLEKIEFVDKNAAGALSGYKELLGEISIPRLEIALLKNIAGCYRRMNDFHSAEKIYLDLISQFDQEIDLVGYPVGIVARQLLIKLYSNSLEVDQKVDAELDLFENIIQHRWNIPKDYFDALHNDLENSIKASILGDHIAKKNKIRWLQLQNRDLRLQAFEATGKDFVVSEWPKIFIRLRNIGALERFSLLQIGPNSRSDLLLSLPLWNSNKNNRLGRVVVLVDGGQFWNHIRHQLSNLTEHSKIHFELVENKNPFHQEFLSMIELEKVINLIDPPIRLRLFATAVSDTEKLYKRRARIFGGIIALAFIVILTGLIAMSRAMRQEMEIIQLKSDFVSNVSHELRTPLTAISYIGERLIQGRYRSQDEAKEFYTMLNEEAERLKKLIEDVLDFSKILSGKRIYKRIPSDLIELAREAESRFSRKAIARGFTIFTDWPKNPIKVNVDYQSIVQALLNLLDNALKYSGTSHEIRLCVKEENNKGILSVQDFGVGISVNEQEKIFEKFYRIENTFTQYSEGGVGLGLAMVKDVVESQGGKIKLESEIGKGSVFSLIFPLYL